jgi:hypothetical protein
MRRSTAKKVIECDGIIFDSKDEMLYYKYLLDLQSKGMIRSFERQVRIELIPALTTFEGNKQKPICYVADFLVHVTAGYSVYVEIKGFASPLDMLKRKLYHYWSSKQSKQIPLQWMSYSKKYSGEIGFIDYDVLQKIRAKAKKDKIAQNQFKAV